MPLNRRLTLLSFKGPVSARGHFWQDECSHRLPHLRQRRRGRRLRTWS
jgi:hypothetical protein